MLWWRLGSFNAAFENFKNGTGDFNTAVKSFLAQEHKDPKVARDMILKGIDKLTPEKRTPEIQKLKVSVERTTNAEDLVDVLNDSSTAVSQLERSGMAGINKLSTWLGASAASASHPFHGAELANGGVKIAQNKIVAKDPSNTTTWFRVNLNSDQQAKVREVLDGVTDFSDDSANTQKLQSIFPGYDATRAEHTPEDKKKLLTELKKQL